MGLVVCARDFAVVVKVGRNAVVPDHGSSGANQEAVAANLCPIQDEAGGSPLKVR